MSSNVVKYCQMLSNAMNVEIDLNLIWKMLSNVVRVVKCCQSVECEML